MAEADPLVEVDVLEIRSPFFQCHGSIGDMDLVEFSDQVESKYSGDSAHRCSIKTGSKVKGFVNTHVNFSMGGETNQRQSNHRSCNSGVTFPEANDEVKN